MRVLLVEDDRDLSRVVVRGLRQEHLAVDHAGSLRAAVDLLRLVSYDVVCLDLGLPDGDGLDLCRRLPVDPDLLAPRRLLVLTARDAVEDRVAGLDAGADDYLVKPFRVAELAARVRALARRDDQPGGPVVVGDLVVDLVRHRVHRGGVEITLTGREFAVLRWFCHHVGEVVSSEDLLEHCWDVHADPFTGSVRVILSRLRRKLGDPPLLHTIRGVGYRLEPVP